MRVKDDGESECRSVMDRIEVQTLPQYENMQTSVESLIVKSSSKVFAMELAR